MIVESLQKRISALADTFRLWIDREPNRKLTLSASGDDFRETLVSSDYVVGLVLECIRSKTPVVLSGPRGCGKTYCVLEAVKRAVDGGIVFGSAPDLESWGYVMAQGNKELPREYLMEDEARVGGTKGNVSLELKHAPLLRFASRKADGTPDVAANGSLLIDAKHKSGGRPFVLFLDEINRFSDGVLDSLLLLLEEGEIIRDGVRIKLDCSVVMTMNPPGYDGTAKRLSPPLQARLGRVLQLCTPDFTTTYAITLAGLKKANAQFSPDDEWSLRRACLASIALWGRIKSDSAAFRYLTPQTRDLLSRLSEDPERRRPMDLLARECSYGPDVRGVKYWFSAALLRRDSLMKLSPKAQRQGLLEQCLRDTFGQTMFHRLSTRFVEATSAKQLAEVEAAASAVVDTIMMLAPPSRNSREWNPLRTVFDELEPFAERLESYWGITPHELRLAWQSAGRSSDADLVEFANKLAPDIGSKSQDFGAVLDALETTGIVFERSMVNLAALKADCSTRFPELARVVGTGSAKGLLAAVNWMYSPAVFGDTNADDAERLLQEALDACSKLGWQALTLDAFLNSPAQQGAYPDDALLRRVVEQYKDESGPGAANPLQREAQVMKRYAEKLIACNLRLLRYVEEGKRGSVLLHDDLSLFLANMLEAWLTRYTSDDAEMRVGDHKMRRDDVERLRDRLAPKP